MKISASEIPEKGSASVRKKRGNKSNGTPAEYAEKLMNLKKLAYVGLYKMLLDDFQAPMEAWKARPIAPWRERQLEARLFESPETVTVSNSFGVCRLGIQPLAVLDIFHFVFTQLKKILTRRMASLHWKHFSRKEFTVLEGHTVGRRFLLFGTDTLKKQRIRCPLLLFM